LTDQPTTGLHGSDAHDEIVARVHEILDHAPDGCFEADAQGMITFVNRRWTDMTGQLSSEALGAGWAAMVHPEDRDRLLKNWKDTSTRGQTFAVECRVMDGDGGVRWLAVNAEPVRGEGGGGDVVGYLGWLRDVTKKIELEQYLERALMDQVKVSERARRQLFDLQQARSMLHTVERQFETVFERAPLGISIVDLDGRILEVNRAMCDMSGYARDDVIGASSMMFMTEEDQVRTTKVVVDELIDKGSAHVAVEHHLIRADGSTRWVLSDTSIVRDDSGTPVFTVTLSADLTERKLFEDHLAHEASHDPLTGLPNRAMLRELLEQAAARTNRHHGTLAVMFVDLDRFKEVNDQLGHAAGDHVLIEAANRIRGALRLGDVVARYGGDEFVVLCEDAGAEAGSLTIADRIRAAMRLPFVVDGEVTGVGASVGISLSDGSDDIDVLLGFADEALYEAKRSGRDRSIVHDRLVVS
jgi:diguanylate cyclase (GGDEF)-like protein/PAS domain S-box-containing protein